MSKIILLLLEINSALDNIDSPGNIKTIVDLHATENKVYLPSDYGADGFGKVNVDLRGKVKVSSFNVTNDCINEEGRWEGDVMIDTSLMTSFSSLFYNVTKLRYLDASSWDTSNVTSDYMCFHSCTSLEWLNITSWDCSKFTTAGVHFFYNCGSLTTLIGGATIEEVLANNISCMNGLKVGLTASKTKLDRASLRALINGLAEVETTQTLTFGSLKSKLTEEDIAIATNKGWSIA